MVSVPTLLLHYTTQIADDTILLPSKVVKKLRIEARFISIVVGTNQLFIKIIPSRSISKLGIHPALAERLCLNVAIENAIPLHYSYNQKHEVLSLGPVLSILVNPIKEDVTTPFGNITPFALELSEIAKRRGLLLYFITADELSNNTFNMDGWFFTTEWQRLRLPFPNVVYNRIANRVIEQSESVQNFLTTLDKLQIPYFNSRFFNKDEVFKALEKDYAATAFLPDSLLLKEMNQVKYMLNTHPTVYIKPINGRHGKGIYRVQRTLSPQGFRLEHAHSSRSQTRFFSSLDRLCAHLKVKLSKQSYQLQQGIRLAHSNQRPIDFRVLVQKNGKGIWTVTSIVARTAANDIFVSNIAKGGTIGSVQSILPSTSLSSIYSAESLTTELKRTAILISKAFESNFSAVLGELGIDLALDENGKIWLLEINGKPSKLTTAKLKTVRIRPSVRMLIAYTLYISGFCESERLK